MHEIFPTRLTFGPLCVMFCGEAAGKTDLKLLTESDRVKVRDVWTPISFPVLENVLHYALLCGWISTDRSIWFSSVESKSFSRKYWEGTLTISVYFSHLLCGSWYFWVVVCCCVAFQISHYSCKEGKGRGREFNTVRIGWNCYQNVAELKA